jgi:carbon storage regulator
MLVLARRTNEAVVIDHAIVVTVLSVEGGVVRLGVEAPRDVPVHRHEVELRVLMDRERERGG